MGSNQNGHVELWKGFPTFLRGDLPIQVSRSKARNGWTVRTGRLIATGRGMEPQLGLILPF